MSENMKVILWMSALNTAFWVGLHFGVGALISRFLPARLATVTPDYLRQFAEETCRAEIIHWCIAWLGFSSIAFAFLLEKPVDYLSLFFIIALVLFLAQLPFIFIQRFNRPRLLRLINALEAKMYVK